MQNKKLILFVTMFAFLLNLTIVNAADIRMPGDDGNITLEKGETVENLYTTGATININNDTQKGLHAIGASILLNGDVGQSAYVAGGAINMRGNIGGSAHVAGGNIVIDSKIADDLFVAGGNVTILSTASIGGDLIIAGGNVLVDGPVFGDVILKAGQASINGKISGSVDGDVEKLKLGEKAEIGKNLQYRSPGEAVISEGARVLGKISFEETVIEKTDISKEMRSGLGGWFLVKFLTIGILVKLLILITTGLFLVYLLRKFIEPISKDSLNNFWPSLATGFAGLVLTPFIIVILAATVLGMGVAGMLLLLYILLLIVSNIIAFLTLGSWIVKFVTKKDKYQLSWKEIVVGALSMMILGVIPFVGWFVALLFMLISLGSILNRAHKLI